MNIDRLLPLLRCTSCNGELSFSPKNLKCLYCGDVFPVVDGIPVMLRPDEQEQAWAEYFRGMAEKRGDTAAVNSYWSVKNFNFVQEHILRIVGDAKNLSFLDVGCGTGHFFKPLLRDNILTGVDVSLEVLKFARQRGFSVIRSSGKRLPLESGGFDVVLSTSVIQSVNEGEVFVRELVRVAKPGGRIILSTTNGRNLTLSFFKAVERRKYRHLRVYTAREVEGFFKSAGCPVRSFLFLYFPFGLARKVEKGHKISLCDQYLASTFVVEAWKPGEDRHS